METKACRRCGKSFPMTAEFFHVSRVDRTGFVAYCKPCKQIINKEWREENADRHNEARARWRKDAGPGYKAWCAMHDRCRNPNNKEYKNYGGRGISVCEQWKRFENFALDVGRRPSAKHSLDRIDNSRGYEPGNVRWADAKRQHRNKRSNHLLTMNGKTQTIADWAEEKGMKYNTVAERIRRYNWTVEQALTLKPQRGKKPKPI